MEYIPVAHSGVILSGDHARFYFMALDLLILSLAVARLSSLFVNEEGPFGMFERLRIWAGILYDFENNNARIVVRPHKRAWLGDVLNCVYCFGVWAATVVWTVYLISPRVAVMIFAPLAIAHAALYWLRKLDG